MITKQCSNNQKQTTKLNNATCVDAALKATHTNPTKQSTWERQKASFRSLYTVHPVTWTLVI